MTYRCSMKEGGGADNFIAGNCFILINNVPHFALYRIIRII